MRLPCRASSDHSTPECGPLVQVVADHPSVGFGVIFPRLEWGRTSLQSPAASASSEYDSETPDLCWSGPSGSTPWVFLAAGPSTLRWRPR